MDTAAWDGHASGGARRGRRQRSRLSTKGDLDDKIKARIKFNPTLYILGVLLAMLILVSLAVANSNKHKKKKQKHLAATHAYVGGTLDGISDERIKEVQRLYDPETHGPPKHSPEEIKRGSPADFTWDTSKHNW